MFTRLLTWTGATKVEGGVDYLRTIALPIVRQQRGYQGLSASLERSTNMLSVLSAWDTESDRQTSQSALAKAREEVTGLIGGTLRVELLEVVSRELVKQPQAGCALLLSPFSLFPSTIDAIVTFVENDIVPEVKAAEGFCALQNMVDRNTGDGYVATVWENPAAMESQRKASLARRDAAGSQRGITFGPLSFREILLVDNP